MLLEKRPSRKLGCSTPRRLRPPCIRQRPLAIAGCLHSPPLLVFAPQRFLAGNGIYQLLIGMGCLRWHGVFSLRAFDQLTEHENVPTDEGPRAANVDNAAGRIEVLQLPVSLVAVAARLVLQADAMLQPRGGHERLYAVTLW